MSPGRLPVRAFLVADSANNCQSDPIPNIPAANPSQGYVPFGGGS